MRTYGAAAAATARTYAPRPSVAALATGLRVDPLDGSRVELAPALGSFPTIANLLTSAPVNVAYDNVAGFGALATSGGVATMTITGTNDFSSAAHSAPFLSRFMPNGGGAWRLTAHISGTMPGTNSQGVGLGIWDAVTGTKTCRMACYYTGSAVKWYSGYATTETSGTLPGGAADVVTGVWLEIESNREGTLTTRYQVAAYDTGVAPHLRRPAAGWTTAQTGTRFFRDWAAPQWIGMRYGWHGLKTAGADFSGLVLNHLDDSQMSVAGGVRSTRDGVGIGVSASSPEITLIDAAPVDWTVCTQARLRAALGAVGTLRDGETGTVEFQIDGGSWVAASAATVGVGATTTIKLRLVSTGLTLASADIDAIQSMRLT